MANPETKKLEDVKEETKKRNPKRYADAFEVADNQKEVLKDAKEKGKELGRTMELDAIANETFKAIEQEREGSREEDEPYPGQH